MTIRKHTVTLVSAAGQTGTGYSPYISGYIESIQYVKDGGANPYANGVDFTITAEATGETIWAEDNVNASTIRHPRAATHDNVGAASLYVALGEAVNGRIALGRDRVKIAIAQAGGTKTGSFVITASDN